MKSAISISFHEARATLEGHYLRFPRYNNGYLAFALCLWLNIILRDGFTDNEDMRGIQSMVNASSITSCLLLDP